MSYFCYAAAGLIVLSVIRGSFKLLGFVLKAASIAFILWLLVSWFDVVQWNLTPGGIEHMMDLNFFKMFF